MDGGGEIRITGYLEGGECAHCGRELRHVICTDGAGQVGARCFANALTKPRVYQGKKYRIGVDQVIYLAKRARNPERYGLHSSQFRFEAAS